MGEKTGKQACAAHMMAWRWRACAASLSRRLRALRFSIFTHSTAAPCPNLLLALLSRFAPLLMAAYQTSGHTCSGIKRRLTR